MRTIILMLFLSGLCGAIPAAAMEAASREACEWLACACNVDGCAHNGNGDVYTIQIAYVDMPGSPRSPYCFGCRRAHGISSPDPEMEIEASSEGTADNLLVSQVLSPLARILGGIRAAMAGELSLSHQFSYRSQIIKTDTHPEQDV